MPNANAIAIPCAAYKAMASEWDLITDLCEGTAAMRKRRQKWLPREQGEDVADYERRLNRTFLYPGLVKSMQELIAKPFAKPVSVDEGLPSPLDRIAKNVDRQGSDITQFARGIFKDLLKRGITHILVDMPEEAAKNSLDAEKRDVRAYFVHVKATDLIGWSPKMEDGRKFVTSVRIEEKFTEVDANGAEKTTHQIRKWTIDTWEIWQKGERDWTKVRSGLNELLEVPLVSIQADADAEFMEGRSPLSETADLNLAHWQSCSDQRNILRFARAAILWRSGVTSEERDTPVSIGPGASHASTSTEADMKFVEHTGASIKSGAEDLRDLEEKMASLALEPVTQKSGDPTATGKAIDEGRANSLIHQWIRAVETGIESAYALAAKWEEVEIPETWGGVTIFGDFGLTIRASEDIAHLREARKDRDITRKTYLTELKRRALFADTFDIDAELDAVESEGPDLAAVMDELKKARNQPTPGAPAPPGSTPDLKVGDRVKVRSGKAHNAETQDASGTIAEISSPAIAVKFDGMGDVHRWYTASELESEQPSGGAPASAMGASHGG